MPKVKSFLHLAWTIKFANNLVLLALFLSIWKSEIKQFYWKCQVIRVNPFSLDRVNNALPGLEICSVGRGGGFQQTPCWNPLGGPLGPKFVMWPLGTSFTDFHAKFQVNSFKIRRVRAVLVNLTWICNSAKYHENDFLGRLTKTWFLGEYLRFWFEIFCVSSYIIWLH